MNNVPILTPELIDTLDEGNRVMILNPATNELIECTFHLLDEEGHSIFFTTADSNVAEYHRMCEDGDLPNYREHIKHVRRIDGLQAGIPAAEMKSMIRDKRYRIA